MGQINIIVSSQTGNAFSAAKYIKDNLTSSCKIYNIDTISISSILKESLSIFIISTHGNGNFPYSAQKYWNILKNKNMPNVYAGKFFAIFGLGDSNYEKFNYAAKKLYFRIKNLGGQEYIQPAYGDEQDIKGIYTELIPWTNILRNKLNNDNIISVPLEYELVKFEIGTVLSKEFYANNTILQVGIDLRISDYRVGDVIGILPKSINISKFNEYNNIAIEDIYDINCIPSFYLIEKLYIFACENRESIFDWKRRDFVIRKLKELSSDYDMYYDYIKRVRRTFFEVLKDLYIRVSSDFIKENVGKIFPRFFTLQQIDGKYFILISLVEYKNELKDKRVGLTSEYLRHINLNSTIEYRKHDSLLNFSKGKLLIFCTGSGITVARTCWRNLNNLKEIIVYYGHRGEEDRLYSEYHDNLNIINCPSREGEKKYVQQIFYENFTGNIEDYDILVAGGSYLNKEISKILFKKYKRKIPFQAETW